LLAATPGSIDWDCLVPRARAWLALADGTKVEGLGYVERLDMTIRPWHLPIRELRWGRFLSDNASAVWIEWRGAQPLVLLYINGSEIDRVTVGDHGIAWPGGRLELEQDLVLRDGQLGSTVLVNVPLATILTPRVVLETRESKRLCRGKLVDGSGRVDQGWAIDEVVHFGG